MPGQASMAQPDSTDRDKERAAPMSPDACQAVLAEVRSEVDALRDKYLRAVAEAENARKWAERDAQAGATESQRLLLRELDNLERALTTPADAAELRQGVDMTLRQFMMWEAGQHMRLTRQRETCFEASWQEPADPEERR